MQQMVSMKWGKERGGEGNVEDRDSNIEKEGGPSSIYKRWSLF